MPRKVNKARLFIYGVKERRRILAMKHSNALIAAAILEDVERQLLAKNRIEPNPTVFPVIFCVSILLLFTAFAHSHVFYNNM